MNCPVCDKEHDALLCPACGFDTSRDYAQHPTFGPVGSVQSAGVRRRERYQRDQEKVEQISALLAALLAIRYLKLIEVDPYVRAADLRLRALSAELSRSKAASRQAQHLNQELLSSLNLSQKDKENISEDRRNLEKELQSQIRSNADLRMQIRSLKASLKEWQDWHKALSRENGSKVLQIRNLEQEISNLKEELAAERNKGVLDRLFNR